MLADHAPYSPYTPSGTLNCIGLLWGSNFYWPLRALKIRQRDQYKPNRHRLVQKKWAITKNMHISPNKKATTNNYKHLGSRGRGSRGKRVKLRADCDQHHYQMYLGLLQKGARLANQNRKITKYKTDKPGAPLALRPSTTSQFSQQKGEQEQNITTILGGSETTLKWRAHSRGQMCPGKTVREAIVSGAVQNDSTSRTWAARATEKTSSGPQHRHPMQATCCGPHKVPG